MKPLTFSQSLCTSVSLSCLQFMRLSIQPSRVGTDAGSVCTGDTSAGALPTSSILVSMMLQGFGCRAACCCSEGRRCKNDVFRSKMMSRAVGLQLRMCCCASLSNDRAGEIAVGFCGMGGGNRICRIKPRRGIRYSNDRRGSCYFRSTGTLAMRYRRRTGGGDGRWENRSRRKHR